MEVQKHPHHVTHKKKWGEYLLEFFMLFLAVFLGFVAENIRENVVERDKEKDYIKSLAEDLETDFTRMDHTKVIYDDIVNHSDTLLHLIMKPDSNTNHIYNLSQICLSQYAFLRNERTIQQLKSQGGFRVITNKELTDKILHYDVTIDWMNSGLHSSDLKLLEKEEDMCSKIFDVNILQKQITPNLTTMQEVSGNPPLLSTDKTLLNQYSYFVQRRMIYLMAEKANLNRIQNTADSLIEYLVKEYSFVKKMEVNNASYLNRKLEQTLENQGKDAFFIQYKEYSKASEKVGWSGEWGVLNTMGYDFLRKKKFELAIIVFQLQTQEFPGDSNAWDSLGDGYAATKDTASAIMNYKKAIKLNADTTTMKKIKFLERK